MRPIRVRSSVCSRMSRASSARHARGAQHRRMGAGHRRHAHHRRRPEPGVGDTVQSGLQCVPGRPAGRAAAVGNAPRSNGARGTIIFTNASAALKGWRLRHVLSCQVRSGAEHGARADAAGHSRRQRPDRRGDRLHTGGRHARAPACRHTVDDNMADRDRIAELYLQLHRQHRSTWAYEVVLGRGSRNGEPRCASPGRRAADGGAWRAAAGAAERAAIG